MLRTGIPAALAFIVMTAPAYPQGGGKTLLACDMLSEKEAIALSGGPLVEVSRDEIKPTAENGHDHNTVCGYFPKGYNLRKADRPPERGVQVQLHALRSRDDAKQFYEAGRGVAQERAKMPKGTSIVSLPGTGEAAFLQTRRIEPEPGAVYEIAIVQMLKGSVMSQVTVWRKGAPADEAAKSAARQVASRLP